jgi:hypothetical protein
MSDGGGGYDEPNVDAAQEAMRQVHELFGQDPGAGVEQIRALDGYGEIPEPVRRAIEQLSFGERLLVHRVFSELGDIGFFPQGGFGPRAGY